MQPPATSQTHPSQWDWQPVSNELLNPEQLASLVNHPRTIGYYQDGTAVTTQTPLDQCPSGTEIRVSTTVHVIPIWHYGILVNTKGRLTVIHCTRDEGVVETSVAAFGSSGGRIEANRIPRSDGHQRMILDTAGENLKCRAQWSWGSNCEDFTNFCYTHQKGSIQRNRAYFGLGLTVLIGFAIANGEE